MCISFRWCWINLCPISDAQTKDILDQIEAESRNFGLSLNNDERKITLIDRVDLIQHANILTNYENKVCHLFTTAVLSKTLETQHGNMPKTLYRGWLSYKRIALKQILKVKTLIFAVFLCGEETWIMKAVGREMIDAFEMWVNMALLLRISWMENRTNASIMKDVTMCNSWEIASDDYLVTIWQR